MKDYWLVINYLDQTIEICFPDNKMNLINACLATISLREQEKLLDILKAVHPQSEPLCLEYEYFTLRVTFENIIVVYRMFDPPSRYFLYTKDLIPALGEYLVEYKKMMGICD